MKYIHSVLIIFFSISTYADYTIIEAKYGKEDLGILMNRKPDVRAYLYAKFQNNNNQKISSVFIYKFLNSPPSFCCLQYHLKNKGVIRRQNNKPKEEETKQLWDWNNDLQENEQFEEKLSDASIEKLFEMLNEIKEDTIPLIKNHKIDNLKKLESITGTHIQ